MPCENRCYETRMRDQQGKIVMVAVAGNKKFAEGTKHPMCHECADARMRAIAIPDDPAEEEKAYSGQQWPRGFHV
jgi:hypothetical protein